MKILITGGCGFIGSNVAEFYASKGHDILVVDNLSRKGSSINLNYLKKKYINIDFRQCDIRFYRDLSSIFKDKIFDVVFHFAAQVAVTTSVKEPREDFEINALGTFNVLESIRTLNPNAFLIYTSTNKVYGEMEDIGIEEKNGRYQFKDTPEGISEKNVLDFHSPYGCSKGAADQYVRDYSRIYGLKTIVFRMSCIYGLRQFGIEDQGWVAWFTIASAFDKRIIIYGDGKQVRDVLYIDDLIRAYDSAIKRIDTVRGQVINVGGGSFQMSLLELIRYLETYSGKKIDIKYSNWRPGDQPVYVSNISKAKKELDWIPQISPKEGVQKLYQWVKKNKSVFQEVGIID